MTTRAGRLHEAAARYLEQRWQCIPVKPREKMPAVGNGWQFSKLPLDKLTPLLAEESNIGVLLGGASNGLVDVDLDCAEAATLAPLFLPDTWVFGRPSKLRSHWLYVCQGVKTEKFQFADPDVDAPGMLLELRSTGAQTVFPPSIHKSGELIEWEPHDTEAPRGVDVETLRRRAAKLASAALVMRYAGEDAARAWAAGAPCPAIPLHVVEAVRRWLGATPPPDRRAAPRYVSSDVVRRASQYLARIPPAIAGSGGHSQTLLAAEHMVRGFELSDEAALQLLEEEYNPRCDPPWSRKELEHKVRQAREKGTAIEFGSHLKRGAS